MTIKQQGILGPETYAEAVEFAERIAAGKNPFVPDYYGRDPGTILAAILYGSELGLSAMQSLQGLIVMQGKVTLYVSTMRALVDRSGLMEKCVVDFDRELVCATVRIKRVGREEAVYTFDKQDALAAGVSGRKMYQSYPGRMYKARALGFALRDEFGDVLRGLMATEEMADGDQPIEDIQGDAAQPEPLGQLEGLEPGLAASLRTGLAGSGLTPGQQEIKLREYQGREPELLEELREAWMDKHNVVRGVRLRDDVEAAASDADAPEEAGDE